MTAIGVFRPTSASPVLGKLGAPPRSSLVSKPPKIAGTGLLHGGPVRAPAAGVGALPSTLGAAVAPSTMPGTASAAAPTNAGPSPYDATYYADLNNATLKAGNQINTYNQQSANADTNLQSTLAQLAHQQTLAVTNNENAENARGGFALGNLGHTIGETNRAYLDKQSGDTQSVAEADAGRSAAIAAVRAGLPLTQVALAAASADRASALDAANKALGAGTPVKSALGSAPRKGNSVRSAI